MFADLKKMFKREPFNITVFEGEFASLPCDAPEGNPVPEVSWGFVLPTKRHLAWRNQPSQITIWNRARPRALVQNLHTRELVSARNTPHKHNNSNGNSSKNKVNKLYQINFWWSLYTLYFLACQVTLGDSSLCCCVCVTSFERWLTPLCVEPQTTS